MARDKGARIEREIVEHHRKLGIKSERYPLSGATHFRGQGHDIDIYAFGDEEAPAVAEVKARKTGAGFGLLLRWLGDFDILFMRRDREQPLVVLPWRTYARLICKANGKAYLEDGKCRSDDTGKGRGPLGPTTSP